MIDTHEGELDNPPAQESAGVVLPEPQNQTIDVQRPIDVEEASGIFNVTAAQEGTRAKIALFFTQMFLLLVVASLLAPFVFYLIAPETAPQPLASSKELVTIMASVLGGPFGFIVGFYFKQNQG